MYFADFIAIVFICAVSAVLIMSVLSTIGEIVKEIYIKTHGRASMTSATANKLVVSDQVRLRSSGEVVVVIGREHISDERGERCKLRVRHAGGECESVLPDELEESI